MYKLSKEINKSNVKNVNKRLTQPLYNVIIRT